jgi:hypothetical protein
MKLENTWRTNDAVVISLGVILIESESITTEVGESQIVLPGNCLLVRKHYHHHIGTLARLNNAYNLCRISSSD